MTLIIYKRNRIVTGYVTLILQSSPLTCINYYLKLFLFLFNILWIWYTTDNIFKACITDLFTQSFSFCLIVGIEYYG